MTEYAKACRPWAARLTGSPALSDLFRSGLPKICRSPLKINPEIPFTSAGWPGLRPARPLPR
jgi:hypothetical protein